MAYEHKPGEFTMFENDRKTNDSQPDMKGSGRLEDGTLKDVAGWRNTTKNGRDYIKFRLSEPLPRGRSDAEDF